MPGVLQSMASQRVGHDKVTDNLSLKMVCLHALSSEKSTLEFWGRDDKNKPQQISLTPSSSLPQVDLTNVTSHQTPGGEAETSHHRRVARLGRAGPGI